MVASKRGTLEAEAGIMSMIERFATKEVHRALDRLRKIQVRYQAVPAVKDGRVS